MPPVAAELRRAIVRWFDRNERPLPWRSTDPWGVLVSEFMLQQTPVDRVLPVWQSWLERWPSASALAQASQADALRAWGRLGYPRRAIRLHAAARAIVAEFAGQIPDTYEELRRLPGVGDYTAAAVLAFAFGQRSVVLDVNVRRVLRRAIDGVEHPTPATTAAERALAESLLPRRHDSAARWSAAVMELGALVCTSRSPKCGDCPIAQDCTWLNAGSPTGERPRQQAKFSGSDRQVRGLIMAALRDSPVAVQSIDYVWPDEAQRLRALVGLMSDGLIVETTKGWTLPQ
ncbi:MAG: A/G-specific adenine glycosylase [Actinobacteria bacterium]|nr:A/G-specific adenine glycosylase [Actinomycetota bacterium]